MILAEPSPWRRPQTRPRQYHVLSSDINCDVGTVPCTWSTYETHLRGCGRSHVSPGAAPPAGSQLPSAAAGRGPWLGGYEQLRQHLVRDAHCLAALQALRQAGCQLVLALLTHKPPFRAVLLIQHGVQQPCAHEAEHCRISCGRTVLSVDSRGLSASQAPLPLTCRCWTSSHQQPIILQWHLDGAHQDVVLAHDLVEEGVAGAEVGGKDCVLISRAAALHLQPEQPDMNPEHDCKLVV